MGASSDPTPLRLGNSGGGKDPDFWCARDDGDAGVIGLWPAKHLNGRKAGCGKPARPVLMSGDGKRSVAERPKQPRPSSTLLTRWLRARGVEAYVIHPTSIPVSREQRRAKSDRLDIGCSSVPFLAGCAARKNIAACPRSRH